MNQFHNTIIAQNTCPCSTYTISLAATNLNCNGDNTGTATATASGGVAPFSYLWTPSGQTTSTATGLSAGAKSVDVWDELGNACICSISITEPASIIIALVPPTPTACGTLCNGTVTANPSGGTKPYSYSWTNGQTTSTATGLCPGTYTIKVSDAYHCTKVRITTVNDTCVMGINEQNENQNLFLVYPSVTTGMFFIEGDKSPIEIEVMDVVGQRVMKIEQLEFSGSYKKEIRLDSFKTGMYFINIRTKWGVVVKKIFLK